MTKANNRILLTGADGLLGSNIARILLDRGYEVRAFLLTGVSALTLDGLSIEKVYGDLLNPASIEEATQGCDYVIHAAANTSIWPMRSEFIKRVNIEGTRNVVAACQKADVKRLVQISSAASFGFGTKEQPGDETQPFTGDKYGLDYIDSKYEAQLLTQQAFQEGLVEAIFVNPTFMFGPYDSKPSSGKMLLGIYEGKVPGYALGGKNFVDVRDVATAAINALTMGRPGECYIAGNQNLSYEELFALIAEVLDVKPPSIRMSPFMIKAFGWMGTLAGRVFGITPALSHAMARVSCDGQYFTAAKAVEELNMPQTPLDKSIRDAFDWLSAHGYVKKTRAKASVAK